jgi:hypothetical protein
MKFCVISDSHGSFDYIEKLGRHLKGKVSLILHLGDDSCDANDLVKMGFSVVKVPGLYEPAYHSSKTERRKIEVIDTIKFLLTHTPKKDQLDFPDEPGPEDMSGEADAVLYGHTHIPDINTGTNTPWINPGHLKEKDKRGYPPTYCIIETLNNESGAPRAEPMASKSSHLPWGETPIHPRVELADSSHRGKKIRITIYDFLKNAVFCEKTINIK